jgi:P27 family predicted phage terminase small subunit
MTDSGARKSAELPKSGTIPGKPVFQLPRPPKVPQWRAPRYLRAQTRRWFARVAKEYVLEEHQARVLTTAAEAWDRMTEAREILAREGLTYRDRYGAPKPRPEIAVERDSRVGFLRALRELNLESAPDEPRPPRLGGRRDR